MYLCASCCAGEIFVLRNENESLWIHLCGVLFSMRLVRMFYLLGDQAGWQAVRQSGKWANGQIVKHTVSSLIKPLLSIYLT